jgi:ectoine hydroxylase-related dioxygenase (phytanoyl-CoA dioxygenase family)
MNKRPLGRIGAADRAAYEADGVVCLRGMFDRDWVERMTAAIDRAMATPGDRVREHTKAGAPGRFYARTFMWRWDRDFRDFIFDSPAAEIAGCLMGADEVRFFYDQIFVKEPGTREVTYWHHDMPYWPMRGNHIASLWLALTPVTRESSGVEYIAGSHKWGKFYRAVTPDRNPNLLDQTLEECPDFGARRDDPSLRFLSWEMAPGDVLVHHPLTVHGAGGNPTVDRRRVALSTRYLGRDARWDPRPATMKVDGTGDLCAGQRPVSDVFPIVWRADMPASHVA